MNVLEFDFSKASIAEVVEQLNLTEPGTVGEIIFTGNCDEEYLIIGEAGEVPSNRIEFRVDSIESAACACFPRLIELGTDKDDNAEMRIYEGSAGDEKLAILFSSTGDNNKEFCNTDLLMELLESINSVLWGNFASVEYASTYS